MKTCSNCGISNTPDFFYRNIRTSDGLSGWCRVCHTEASKMYKQKLITRKDFMVDNYSHREVFMCGDKGDEIL